MREEHDRGLAHDLRTLLSRRTLLLLGGAGLAAAVAGCRPGTGSPSASSAAAAATSGTEIPQETAGPFPGDG